jgi:uncharacterized MnhB-related membrane protein
MMLPVVVLVGVIFCAVAAIAARRLLVCALWLAGASALTALMLYLLGAPEVAVIELSVGAGLVTVLFVFAINIAGEDVPENHPLLPRPLGFILSGLTFGLLAVVSLPRLFPVVFSKYPGLISAPNSIPLAQKFTDVFWQARGLDTLLQVALIFCGVMAILSLLAERQVSLPSLKERLK